MLPSPVGHFCAAGAVDAGVGVKRWVRHSWERGVCLTLVVTGGRVLM